MEGTGDFLTYKFPTWQWQAGDSSKAKDYLPADKQYLISRNVPCLKRVSSMAYTDADEDMEAMIAEGDSNDKEDEWVATHTNKGTSPSTGSVMLAHAILANSTERTYATFRFNAFHG
jgi:ubiquitin-like-conjugating enzyme ATG3